MGARSRVEMVEKGVSELLEGKQSRQMPIFMSAAMKLGTRMRCRVDGGSTTRPPSQNMAMGATWILYLVGMGVSKELEGEKYGQTPVSWPHNEIGL